jgi:hypothetical protein
MRSLVSLMAPLPPSSPQRDDVAWVPTTPLLTVVASLVAPTAEPTQGAQTQYWLGPRV